MKTCSYCGKENEIAVASCQECGTDYPLTRAEVAPELPPPKFIDATEIRAAFEFAESFHRVDWEIVRKWIETHVHAENREQAWAEVALLWVSQLREDVGRNYFVLQSRQTVLLSDLPLAMAQWLLDYAGNVEQTIKRHLGSIAWHGAIGKDVILIFSDQDDYYHYIAHHYPEGEHPTSGGICIHSGYTHVALPWNNEFDAANGIVHELTHDCLAHLSLPIWLNEGVAVTLQKLIAPPQPGFAQGTGDAIYGAQINWQPPMMWDELAERHFAFWTEENIQSFWAGTSYEEPGDANELSYSLAEVFVKLLSERGSGEKFQAFLQAAQSDDAGQTAALDILGADLGEIAGTFLGEGNWRPQRKAMAEFREKAGWNEMET